MDIGHLSNNRPLRPPILPVPRANFGKFDKRSRPGNDFMLNRDLATHVTSWNDDFFAEVGFADTHNMTQSPPHEPTFHLGRIFLAFHVPVLGQHMVGQQENVKHHVTVFFIIDKHEGS